MNRTNETFDYIFTYSDISSVLYYKRKGIDNIRGVTGVRSRGVGVRTVSHPRVFDKLRTCLL